jgi:hypothetical protein
VLRGSRAEPRRARAVRGDLQQRRSPGEPRLPVLQLPVQHVAAQPFALPDGVVRVLHRQLRQPGRLAPARGGVDGGDLARQHAAAPAVADDVVQREQQHVLLSPRRSSVLRSSGPRARSKGRSAPPPPGARPRPRAPLPAGPAGPAPPAPPARAGGRPAPARRPAPRRWCAASRAGAPARPGSPAARPCPAPRAAAARTACCRRGSPAPAGR